MNRGQKMVIIGNAWLYFRVLIGSYQTLLLHCFMDIYMEKNNSLHVEEEMQDNKKGIQFILCSLTLVFCWTLALV